MTIRNFRIKRYKVIFYQPSVRTWGSFNIRVTTIVECFENEEGHWGEALSNEGFLRAYFLSEDSEVPNPFYLPQNDVGGIFLRAKELGPFIDILRNEKPVSVFLDSEHPERNQIFTGLEPVGEEERWAVFG